MAECNYQKDGPRILMYAPLFPPREGPESYVSGKLVQAMMRSGWDTKVVSIGLETLHYNTDNSRLWDNLTSSVYNLNVSNRGMPYNAKVSFWIFKAIRLGLSLHRTNRFDFIMTRTQPTWAHMPGLLLSKMTGVPWIANWNDPAPTKKYPPPYGRGADAKVGIVPMRLFNLVCRGARWHTFACERLRQYMLSYAPTNVAENSSVIPHISPETVEHGHLNGRKQFVIGHSGSTYLRNWREFLQGVRLFLDRCNGNEPLLVRFFGWPDAELGPYAARLGLSHYVSTEDPKPYSESLADLLQCDVLCIIEAACREGIFLPSKIADYAWSGKPILAVSPAVGTLPDLFAAHSGGIAADCTSPEEISHALHRLYLSWKEEALGKHFEVDSLRKLFDEKTIVSQYQSLFDVVKK